jgi:hypothetical protein
MRFDRVEDVVGGRVARCAAQTAAIAGLSRGSSVPNASMVAVNRSADFVLETGDSGDVRL